MLSVTHLEQLDLKLSESNTSRLLAKLEPSEPDEERSKRRSQRRAFHGARLPIALLERNEPTGMFYVCMRNVSQHGAGFLSRVAMNPGASVLFYLPLGPGGKVIHKVAVVRRCAHVEGLIYDIGVEFAGDYYEN